MKVEEPMPRRMRAAVVFTALLVLGLPAVSASAINECHLETGLNPGYLSTTTATQTVTFGPENNVCATVTGLIFKVRFDTAQVDITAASAAGPCRIAHGHGVARCVAGDIAPGQMATMTVTVQVIHPLCSPSDREPLLFRTKDINQVVHRYQVAVRWQHVGDTC